MAPTLVSYLSQPHHYHDIAPPTSPSILMPHVFVVPPEEDESPTWCYFDATEAPPLEAALSTAPDVQFLDSALDIFQTESEAPIFHRGAFSSRKGVVMPRKSMETRSITDVLMNHELHDSDDEMEQDQEYNTQGGSRSGTTAVGNDSEIVEVVKVRRHARDHARPPTPPMKRSKSFKSRASKVFRSIKLGGKGSVRSKPHASEIFPPTLAADMELPSKGKTPTVSRRGSAIFSQLFSPPATLQSRSSVSSFDLRTPTGSSQPVNPPMSKPSSLPYRAPSSIPMSTVEPDIDFLNPSLSQPTSRDSEYQDARSPSPTPSSQTFSTKRRFSMMSLQRLFSFSGDAESTDITPPTMSRDSSGPSTVSSFGPDTPTEENMPLPMDHLHGIDKHDLPTHTRPGVPMPALEPGDISFEMRLDSLHFESLSFDADRF